MGGTLSEVGRPVWANISLWDKALPAATRRASALISEQGGMRDRSPRNQSHIGCSLTDAALFLSNRTVGDQFSTSLDQTPSIPDVGIFKSASGFIFNVLLTRTLHSGAQTLP
jgi:hypothetical protein